MTGPSVSSSATAGGGEPADYGPDAPRVPLREVVASLLVDWGCTSDDSDDSDDFCGWHGGGSQRVAVNGHRWLTDGANAARDSARLSGFGPQQLSQQGQRNSCSVQ